MTAMMDWRKATNLKTADALTVVTMLRHTKHWIKDKQRGETMLDQYSGAEWADVWAIEMRQHRRLRLELEGWLKGN